MRLIDADELMEHVWRDKLDSRESIAKMINDAQTVKDIPTKIPISVFEQLISKAKNCVSYEDAISRKEAISIASIATLSVNQVVTALNKLPPVTPQETVTEFADRCRECGARYGRLLKKSEWEHDHEILKAHSDGANDMLDKIRDRVKLERIGYPPSEGYYKAITKVLQIIDEYSEGSDQDERKTKSEKV